MNLIQPYKICTLVLFLVRDKTVPEKRDEVNESLKIVNIILRNVLSGQEGILVHWKVLTCKVAIKVTILDK